MVYSVGDMTHKPGEIFGEMEWSTFTTFSIFLMIFAFFWFTSYLIATNTFIISAMCSNWYFNRFKTKKIRKLSTYFVWAWFYHFGSLALGSFLIASLWVVYVIFFYLYKILKGKSEDSKKKAGLFLCCVGCFERILQLLTQHVYIEIALRNFNFCKAASKCIKLMKRNSLVFFSLSGLVGLFLMIGTILLSISVTFLGHYLLKLYGNFFNLDFETTGPLIVIFLIALAVSLMFNNIFDISADTMLHCFLLEDEINRRREFANY